jgi:hypothetical protein
MNRDRPEAKIEIDRLTAAFFGLFSNRNGPPDVARIAHLFVAPGIIAKCVEREPEILSLEAFIAPRQQLLTNGSLTDFSEVELSEVTHIFGHIAQRVSTYRKSGVLNGVPFQTDGVKLFQFIETMNGWRILAMSWDDEREGFSIDPP